MAEEIQNLDSGETGPTKRLRLSEMGTLGLKITKDQILEDLKRDLAWPTVINTFKQMGYDATIAASLSLFEMMIERIEWQVLPPVGATPLQKARAEFIKQCTEDMEHSFRSFIKEVVSFIPYGFCINEKVFRKRYRSNGSKYNDGYVGWQKLPVRSQDTISDWMFSDDGREFLGVKQSLSMMGDPFRYRKLANTTDGKIEIPKEKFLLFRYNTKRDNPQGNSPLKNVYLAWKYRQAIEEIEAIGVSRDMGGMPVNL